LYECNGVSVYCRLLTLDYWHTHVLNSLADWATLEPGKLQPILLQPDNLQPLLHVLRRSVAYLGAVLPGLASLLDRSPPLAQAFSASSDFMSDLCAALDVPGQSTFVLKHLLALLRVVHECCAEDKQGEARKLAARRWVEQWDVQKRVQRIAEEAKTQGKVILVPITDAILKLCHE
jgi:hypothetical protein